MSIKKTDNLEERKVIAFEKMAKAFEKIGTALEDRNMYMEDVGLIEWSERFEWYLNEFYQIYKAKTIGENNRPPRDAERKTDTSE
jgi:uncharacterized FlgJ-related protein